MFLKKNNMETSLESLKLIVTGGHPTPSLAVIDYIRRVYPKTDILFIGKKYSYHGNDSLSFEFKEIAIRNVKFEQVNPPRSTSFLTPFFILEIGNLILTLFFILKIFLKFKPDVILTFGGYVGLPVSFLGFLFRIPVVMHEQTVIPGIANSIIAKFASKVCISFPETEPFIPRKELVVSGNPVREEIFKQKATSINIDIKNNLPIIYITGGSLGAHAVNLHIENILPKLLAFANVIHQTGNISEFNDFKRLTNIKNSLENTIAERYHVFDHIPSTDIGYVFHKADLVISRSGANTFFEIIALKKPCILIPLPYSSRNEQLKHAEILKELGVGVVFNQNERSEKLLQLINETLSSIDEKKAGFIQKSKIDRYQYNAAETIAQQIFSLPRKK